MCSRAAVAYPREVARLEAAGAVEIGRLVVQHGPWRRDLVAVGAQAAAEHGGTHVVPLGEAAHLERVQVSPGACTAGAGCTAPTVVPMQVVERELVVLRVPRRGLARLPARLRPEGCGAPAAQPAAQPAQPREAPAAEEPAAEPSDAGM